MRPLYFLLGLALVASVRPAAAEGFLEVFGGGAFTEDDELEFGRSGVVGGRGGVWGEKEIFFVGGALDVSTFSPDEGSIDMDVVPISFLLMGRFPLLRSHDYPNGLLHPYAAVGPSIVVSSIDLPAPGSDFEDTEVDAGADVRGGVALRPIDPIALFLEYRYLHFAPDYEDRIFVSTKGSVSTDVSTHFVQAGIGVRF